MEGNCHVIKLQTTLETSGLEMTARGESKLISVVLGTLNRLPYLKAAVTSVRCSTTSLPLEIIVVDGGSTDGTLAWLARQQDIITVVQHNVDVVDGKRVRKRSWGYFMNLGFKVAQGTLICMISDDSILHPEALENGLQTYLKALENGVNVGAVAFRWRSYPEESQYRIGYTLGGRMFVNHGYYARDALSSVRWIEEEALKFYFADGDVCLRLAEAGYEVICGENSYVEHFEIPKQHAPNVSTELLNAEWAAYQDRWRHLQGPDGVLDLGRFDYKSSPFDVARIAKLIPPCVTRDLRLANAAQLRSKLRRSVSGAVKKLLPVW